MRMKLTYVISLLAAGATAVAMVGAPTASALPKTCVGNGPGTTCRSAVNVEITNPGPDVSLFPSGTMPYLLGGH
jgi:hypothetical protein